MSRNEIRLRRHKMTSHGADRFRNYGAVLQQHEREMRMKKIMRAFTYFLIILIIFLLLVIVYRIEKRVAPVKPVPQQSHSAGQARQPFL